MRLICIVQMQLIVSAKEIITTIEYIAAPLGVALKDKLHNVGACLIPVVSLCQ